MACYDGIIDRDDPNIIVVGTSSGVFVSERWGSNWVRHLKVLKEHLCMKFVSHGEAEEGNGRPGEIYIATFGRGIWASDNYLGLEESSMNEESKLDDMVVYPNPTSSECNVMFDLSKNGYVNIGIYNLSGRLMLNKKFENKVSGRTKHRSKCRIPTKRNLYYSNDFG